MANLSYPASSGYAKQDPTNKKRLNSETWSFYSDGPLLQPSKEPVLFPLMRWVFILLALSLLGFVLFVFVNLFHDYFQWNMSGNKTQLEALDSYNLYIH